VSILVSIARAAALYRGILFGLRGFTIDEVKFFYFVFKELVKNVG
jgi:hypothetical protein